MFFIGPIFHPPRKKYLLPLKIPSLFCCFHKNNLDPLEEKNPPSIAYTLNFFMTKTHIIFLKPSGSIAKLFYFKGLFLLHTINCFVWKIGGKYVWFFNLEKYTRFVYWFFSFSLSDLHMSYRLLFYFYLSFLDKNFAGDSILVTPKDSLPLLIIWALVYTDFRLFQRLFPPRAHSPCYHLPSAVWLGVIAGPSDYDINFNIAWQKWWDFSPAHYGFSFFHFHFFDPEVDSLLVFEVLFDWWLLVCRRLEGLLLVKQTCGAVVMPLQATRSLLRIRSHRLLWLFYFRDILRCFIL